MRHGRSHAGIQMQAVSLAPLPAPAPGTLTLLCPGAVTHILIAPVPHIHKVILVDISLNKVFAPYRKAGRNRTIAHHGTNIYSTAAEEEKVPHLKLIGSKITFT